MKHEPPGKGRIQRVAWRAFEAFPAARTPLLVLDRLAVREQAWLWRRCLPEVAAHYAMKANDFPAVLEDLRELGLGFDAATGGELERLAGLQVEGARILCTHPIRSEEDLEAVARIRPAALVIQGVAELEKLRLRGIPGPAYGPAVLLRVSLPFSNLDKFGARVMRPHLEGSTPTWRLEPQSVVEVFQAAQRIETETGAAYGGFGLAAHVGTNCHEVAHFRLMLALFRFLRMEVEKEGVRLEVFDIGGGYCDQSTAAAHGTTQAELLLSIAEAVQEFRSACPGVRLVAEPGRLFVADAAGLVVTVKSVRRLAWRTLAGGRQEELDHLEVHVDDGIYGCLMGQAHDAKAWSLEPLKRVGDNVAALPTQVWGATCDTFDRIGDLHPLPADLAPGDRLLVPRTGAYSLVTRTNFNAAQAPQVLTFEDEADEGTWRLHDAYGRRLEVRGATEPGLA